ncbi:hypothetical protein [Streptomyces sp. NPDC002588]|uniref:hypothetical protein n=1 Tax=Streptomyces sp. NPDC002588 TaxID=3154419 RepID=UPI00333401A2
MQAPLPRRAKGPSAIAAASAAARPRSGAKGDSATEPEPEATPVELPPLSRAAVRFVADLAAKPTDEAAADPATAAPRSPARRRWTRVALVAGGVVVAAALVGGTFLMTGGRDTRPSASAPDEATDPVQGGGPYGRPPTGLGSPPPSTSPSASPSPGRTSASPKATAKASAGDDSDGGGKSTHTTAPAKSSATPAAGRARTESGTSDDGPSCTSAAGSGPITGYSVCLSSGSVTFRATFHASQPYYHVFLNTDGSTATGYQLPYPSPSALGADYMIENGALYRSRSTDWSWSEVGTSPSMQVSGSTRTWTLPLSGVGSPSGTQRVEFHAGSDYTPVITFSP